MHIFLPIEKRTVSSVCKSLYLVEIPNYCCNSCPIELLKRLSVIHFSNIESKRIYSIRISEVSVLCRVYFYVFPSCALPPTRNKMNLWEILFTLLLVCLSILNWFRRN